MNCSGLTRERQSKRTIAERGREEEREGEKRRKRKWGWLRSRGGQRNRSRGKGESNSSDRGRYKETEMKEVVGYRHGDEAGQAGRPLNWSTLISVMQCLMKTTAIWWKFATINARLPRYRQRNPSSAVMTQADTCSVMHLNKKPLVQVSLLTLVQPEDKRLHVRCGSFGFSAEATTAIYLMVCLEIVSHNWSSYETCLPYLYVSCISWARSILRDAPSPVLFLTKYAR